MSAMYVVQSYSAGARGRLQTDLPVQARDITHARRVAERLSARKPLVIAFVREGDPILGEYGDARLIEAFGTNIPDEVREMPRA